MKTTAIATNESLDTTAYVMPLTDKKFVCVAANKTIGKSQDVDYFELRYRKHDTKKMDNMHIDKFVYLTNTGKIDHINLVTPFKADKSLLAQIKHDAKSIINQVKDMRLTLSH